MEKAKNRPERQERVGRFQVSIWKQEKVIPVNPKADYIPEKIIQIVRACIQYSTRNKVTNEWNNQKIWCEPEDLRQLVQVLDNLNGNDSE